MSATLKLLDVAPTILPRWWTVVECDLPGLDVPALRYTRFRPRSPSMHVLVTLDDAQDGAGIWLHSSTSVVTKRGPGLPSWVDLKSVHCIVHGNRPVVQLLPPRAHWLSITECLHLFERLDAPTVPESLWRRGGAP